MELLEYINFISLLISVGKFKSTAPWYNNYIRDNDYYQAVIILSQLKYN